MSLVHRVANRFSSKYKVSTSVSGSTGMKVYQEEGKAGVLYQYAKSSKTGGWVWRYTEGKSFTSWSPYRYTPKLEKCKTVEVKGKLPNFLQSPISE